MRLLGLQTDTELVTTFGHQALQGKGRKQGPVGRKQGPVKGPVSRKQGMSKSAEVH